MCECLVFYDFFSIFCIVIVLFLVDAVPEVHPGGGIPAAPGARGLYFTLNKFFWQYTYFITYLGFMRGVERDSKKCTRIFCNWRREEWGKFIM